VNGGREVGAPGEGIVAVSLATRVANRGVSFGALVLAAGIPILFLHVSYQPGIAIGFGSTTINAYLSDFAVLAIVLAAIASGVRHGFAPLRAGRPIWIAGGLFCLWMVVEVAFGHYHAAEYAWRTHAVTAAKFAEYALLAPAVALIVRRRADAFLCAWALVLWSACATVAGIAQFFGANIFLAGTVGHRQASFLASADFAALSAAALLVGIVGVALPSARFGRGLIVTAIVTGVLGMIVAGALASVLGLATALVVLVVVLVLRRELELRRLAAIGIAALVVVGGAIAIRGTDLENFAHFLGAKKGQTTSTKVQTYAHRTLLAWIGWEIWKDHPALGVGWEGSAEPVNFRPYLHDAHVHFPNESPLAFPSAAPNRRYGVQNSWLQALADLGAPGLLFWAATFLAAAWTAFRRDRPITIYALSVIAVLVWLWTAQGYVAGIPLDALTWLTFGLVAVTARTE
jgi:O-antigen ligase